MHSPLRTPANRGCEGVIAPSLHPHSLIEAKAEYKSHPPPSPSRSAPRHRAGGSKPAKCVLIGSPTPGLLQEIADKRQRHPKCGRGAVARRGALEGSDAHSACDRDRVERGGESND